MHISNVSKMVHDKVTNNSSQFQAMKYKCEGALKALAVNKDYSQVIVAGLTVFKILHLKEDGFSENINLRSGKHRNINLNFSTADVAWHPSDENIIASASTNGSVVIWNLNMLGKSKQDKILTKHDRSATRVLYHDSEHNQLLSASQDGVVMIHDTRTENSCIKFGVAGNDCVRDAQFCPSNIGYFTFAAAYENGCVQTWDMRWSDKCERQFMAHNGPVTSLDWHPADKTWWLATSGRDRTIKVWDMVRVSSSAHPPSLYSITNIVAVACIKWRPTRKTHISSCSMVVDHCVNVWDLNRPYIPFAAFDGHLDVATSIVWREDCHAFLSCGKDGYVIQHIFNDARRPADHVNLAGIDLSASGDIGHAFCEKKEQTSSSLGRSKKVSRSRQFTQASSALCVFFQSHFDSVDSDVDNDVMMLQWFVDIARSYKLEGSSLVDMCWHNGDVAYHFNKPQVAQFWRMLAVTYTPCLSSQSGTTHNPVSLGMSNTLSDKQDQAEIGGKPVAKRSKEKEKRKGNSRTLNPADATSGSAEDSSEHDGESSEVERIAPEWNAPFLFGDGDGGEEDLEEIYTPAANPFDWTLQRLPSEGFQPRHELNPMIGAHPHMIEDPNTAIASVMDTLRHVEPEVHLPPIQSYEPTLVVTQLHSPEPHDFSPSIAEMICSLADQGDVQSAVSMLIVLGENIRPYIDEAFQECWFFSYIDLLARFELWSVSNTVIKQSRLLGVRSMNQVSTVYHTQCPKCSKACERAPWLCDKCKQVTNICSICHQPVHGLMSWCQGCGHGGHMEHMQEWLEINPKCPAGCGHLCEYS
ncbi:WD repeat-containing protein 24-like [Plakobranchus ocellatus]|uniref:GATOR2 complex protein WDR24 n=1 Tax=Plakobranchus ocellatus TaxID=259542 RepID=A0AAV3Y6G4_9GAST|nr:WD repeat-containing protein 24-like [Plakobranchus ocellatus]